MHLKNIISIFLLSFVGLSSAQTSKTTTIIVPFATGGTVDIVARQLAPDLGKSLGDNIIVDNKGGAGGTIATAKLASSNADGKQSCFTTWALYLIRPYTISCRLIRARILFLSPTLV